MSNSPETKYAVSDDLSIAYQIHGSGRRNFVLVPGMISHLEAQLEHPGYVQLLKMVGNSGRLAVFDKRGNGMSDRIHGAPTLDERMLDIEAVMDDSKMASATIIGTSEGASLACVYAAMRPDRVEKLVLCGGYARGRLARGDLSEDGLHQAQLQFRQNWGKPNQVHPFSAFGPGPDDPEGQIARARFERMCGTPTTVAALFELAARIDIRALLPFILQPTLVLHREDEAPNGRDCAMDFVKMMPSAEYSTVPGSQHLIWNGDVESYVAQIVEFATGEAPAASPGTRKLATVLFSDLVDSTSSQVKIGDEAWRVLMNSHDDICGAQISQHGGSLVKFTGDGVLATFNSPTNALACAIALQDALSLVELDARFGAHTGEIEIRGEDISGLGVVIAARIMDHAVGGQVLASNLTRQLMLGSHFSFNDCGEYELKGVPEKWCLHEVHLI